MLSASYIPVTDFTPHHDPSDLQLYLWNEKVLSQPLLLQKVRLLTYIGDGENARDGYCVNPGCVDGLDPLALDITIIDGKSVPLVEEWR